MNQRFSSYFGNLRGKRAAVIGIGVSNTPLIRLLLSHGCLVTACDRKSRAELGELGDELAALGARLSLGAGYLDGLECDVLFRTPGLRPDVPALLAARENGTVVTSEMEAFMAVCPCPVIGVTGSDGKTTTTTMIGELLRRGGYRVHLGGNIGKPLLAKAAEMEPSDYAVLELSSFQLMTMRQSPHIAVVTNVTPNHLDVHTSMSEYVRAKQNIFMNQLPGDRLVLNGDNPVTAGFVPAPGVEAVFFSRAGRPEAAFYFDGTAICQAGGGAPVEIVRRDEVGVPGLHNIENLMAAFAATDGLVSKTLWRETARSFQGVEHRIEFVRTLDGVRYYNDSIASSPTRTIAGLHAFDQKVILIAGGYDKKIPFDALAVEIPKNVKTLILTGATAEKIKTAVLNARTEGEAAPPILEYGGLEEAVRAARAAAVPGDIVMLSPACASFDRFRDFAERGRTFKNFVMELE